MDLVDGKTRAAVVTAYLDHLGVAAGPPSVDLLGALHRAHVERVAWHNLDIAAGVDNDPDPVAAAGRLAAGRGGHCFELNGAFAMLLGELGFAVRTHRAAIHGRYQRESPGANGTHLALSVSGLPTPDRVGRADDGVWLVDVAAGDLLHEPVPLRPGEYDNGGYRITLHRGGTEPGGWRVDHDRRGGSRGVEISPDPHPIEDQLDSLRFLTHDENSPLRFSTLVQRRHSSGADIMFGPVLARSGRNAQLPDLRHWLAVLTQVFHLRVELFEPAALARLWELAARARPATR